MKSCCSLFRGALAIIAVLFSTNVHADISQKQCQDFRLDDPGGSMEGIVERPQFDDTCYAHAAVDLIDAKLRNGKHQSSAVDAAASFAASRPRSLEEAMTHYLSGSPLYEDFMVNRFLGKTEWGFGITKHLLDHLIANGVCPENKVLSEAGLLHTIDYAPKHHPNGNYRAVLRDFWEDYKRHPSPLTVEKVRDSLKKSEAIVGHMRIGRWVQSDIDELDPIKSDFEIKETDTPEEKIRKLDFLDKLREKRSRATRIACLEPEIGPNLRYSDKNVSELFNSLGDIKKTLEEEDLLRFYSKIFSASCREHDRRKIPAGVRANEYIIRDPYNDPRVQKMLSFNDALDHTQPIAVTFCLEVLHDIGFEGLKNGMPSSRDIMGMVHADPNFVNNPALGAIVSGMRACGLHTAVAIGRRWSEGHCEILIKHTKHPLSKRYDWNFDRENDKIWVPLDVLSRNTTRITCLEGDVPVEGSSAGPPSSIR